jgi:hypothetical protein
MKNCTFEKLLVPYLQDELDDQERSRISEHLSSCENCQYLLTDLQTVDAALMNYKRQAAPAELYSAYEKRLAQLFQPEPAWKTISRSLGAFVSSLFISTLPSFRVARAVAILVIGVFVGRFFFMPTPEPSIQQTVASSQTMLSKEDIQFISNYMVQSELLLLTIANTASTEPTVDDIDFNKDIAQTLLYKTAQVQRKAEALDDDVIVTFLNHLELVLLEISNRDDSEIRDAFENIKDMVNEAEMVQKSRRLQRRLEQTLQDA